MTAARCPKCHIEVGATWRWCLACGYDPDGSAQRVRQADDDFAIPARMAASLAMVPGLAAALLRRRWLPPAGVAAVAHFRELFARAADRWRSGAA